MIRMDELSVLRDELPDREFEAMLGQFGIKLEDFLDEEKAYEQDSI